MAKAIMIASVWISTAIMIASGKLDIPQEYPLLAACFATFMIVLVVSDNSEHCCYHPEESKKDED